jgi:hypothetical protein
MATPYASFIDDLIKRLSGVRPKRAAVPAPDAADFLRQLEDSAKQRALSEEMARGSTAALRARNAELTPLQELAQTDFPVPKRYTPSDVSRALNDAKRKDIRYSQLPPDDERAQFNSIRKAAEQNLADARAAAARAEAVRPELRERMAGDLTNAILGGGAVAAAAAAGANALGPVTYGNTEKAESGLAANLPTQIDPLRAGLFANLPIAPETQPASPAEPTPPKPTQPTVKPSGQYARTSPDIIAEQPQSRPEPKQTPARTAAPPDDKADAASIDLPPDEEIVWEWQPPAKTDEPPPETVGINYAAEAENRYWNNPGVKERKIKRMAKAAGISMDEARQLVADGGVSADGMTDDYRNLTSAGRATEFQKLRDAVSDKRNSDESSRMRAWRAQMMLAGASPRKNMANALNELGDEDRQAALQFMLAGGRGASPLDVQGQQALASRGVAEAQVLNDGRMQQLQAELAAKQDMYDKQLAQSQTQLNTERDLRLRQMEEESQRDLRGIRARAEAAAAQSAIDNQAKLDAILAQVSGSLGAARTEADASRYRADKEAETLASRYANPTQMALTSAQLANTQADRRRAMLEAATNEANRYADDRGAFNNSFIRQWGWDPTLVDANEVGRIRSYLRATDPQATDQEIETVLEAALRNKTRGR